MPTPWITNRYLTATHRNATLASTIGNDVAAVLVNRGASSVAIQTLATYFTAKNAAYQTKFGNLSTADASKEGASLGLKLALKDMRRKANEWRKAVANVFDESTPEYKAIFPNGIGPLTKGKQASILQAVDGLSGSLAAHIALVTVKTDVDNTYNFLNSENTNQKGKVGARDAVSEDLEQERVTLCKALLYVEAGLTQIFIDDLPEVDTFFPLELLRRTPQTEFTGAIAAGQTKMIVKRKVDVNEGIRLYNSGPATLTFYFAPTKTTVYNEGMPSRQVSPTEDIMVAASSIGATDDNVYLLVTNPGDFEGHWTVEL